MTDAQLETQLREVLAVRARELTTDAVERLRRVDYRPRTNRRWPLTMSALGAASGTAAVVSVVVLGGSQTAFAGWSATPTRTTAAQSADTQADCLAKLATVPGGSSPGSWTEEVSDVRGPYSVVLYQNGSAFATCFTGPSFTLASLNSPAGSEMTTSGAGSGTAGSGESSTSSGFSSPGGGIDTLVVSHLALAGNGPYTLVEGSLEPTVSALTFTLSDGQQVTATTANGWFVAWWPSNADVTAVQVTSNSGTTTEPVNSPSPGPLPAANGSSGATTNARGRDGGGAP